MPMALSCSKVFSNGILLISGSGNSFMLFVKTAVEYNL